MRVALSLVAGIALTACAAVQDGMDHGPHHPGMPSATGCAETPTRAQMDAAMTTMAQAHARLAAATSPEERERLMQEHMKSMQDGMCMMRRMRRAHGGMGMDGGMGMGPEAMGRRMDMMEMMMQMMVDREAATPSAAR